MFFYNNTLKVHHFQDVLPLAYAPSKKDEKNFYLGIAVVLGQCSILYIERVERRCLMLKRLINKNKKANKKLTALEKDFIRFKLDLL